MSNKSTVRARLQALVKKREEERYLAALAACEKECAVCHSKNLQPKLLCDGCTFRFSRFLLRRQQDAEFWQHYCRMGIDLSMWKE